MEKKDAQMREQTRRKKRKDVHGQAKKRRQKKNKTWRNKHANYVDLSKHWTLC